MYSKTLTPMTLAIRTALLALFSLFLVACETQSDTVVICPAVKIPLDTERLTRFAPGTGRDITDIVLQAELKFLSGECEVDEETVEMKFPVAVRGERGPAARSPTQQVNVFLAVSTQDRKVLTRREIPMTLVFQGNQTAIVSSDQVTIQIPKRIDQSAKEFILFIGLALSPDELEYNRTESRR